MEGDSSWIFVQDLPVVTVFKSFIVSFEEGILQTNDNCMLLMSLCCFGLILHVCAILLQLEYPNWINKNMLYITLPQHRGLVDELNSPGSILLALAVFKNRIQKLSNDLGSSPDLGLLDIQLKNQAKTSNSHFLPLELKKKSKSFILAYFHFSLEFSHDNGR